MLNLNDATRVKDTEEFRDAYEHLDNNNKSILSTVVACMLARQQMEEQKEAG